MLTSTFRNTLLAAGMVVAGLALPVHAQEDNTGTNDVLGSGKTSLGPTVIGVFPGLVGRGSLFTPAYQYVFDVAGSDDRAQRRDQRLIAPGVRDRRGPALRLEPRGGGQVRLAVRKRSVLATAPADDFPDLPCRTFLPPSA